VKRLGVLRCSNCGELTEHRRHCIACNHPLPQLPVAWGKLAILLFLAALWILLTHIQRT
jgi:hypothetical protein